MQDREGDLIHNAITFAGKFGMKKSTLLVNLISLILIIVLILPYIFNYYNIYYIYVVIPGVITVLIFVSVSLWIKNNAEWLGTLSLLLKIDMFIGLIAIFVGVNYSV